MNPPRSIYLDHNATTFLHPEVQAAMAAALGARWGNPSSVHADGRRAREAVERARREVAALVGAGADEIVFTSGGTEGNHLAIRGLALAQAARRAPPPSGRRWHVVSSAIEHPSVVGALSEIERDGFEVTRLVPGPDGDIMAPDLAAALRDETVLVSLALANHEIGNVYPVRDLAAAAHARGAILHTDAVQAAGRIACDLRADGVDAATISAHKLHGPPGAGAVFVRHGVELWPVLPGGHQEHGRRGGTENLLGIVGFGAAAVVARRDLGSIAAEVGRLRDQLETRLLAIPGARRHGRAAERVPGTSNLAFDRVDGRWLLAALDLDGVRVSTGAACSSGTLSPSPVLLALGLPPAKAREAVRFSLGRGNTADDVDRAADLVAAAVGRARASEDEPLLHAVG